VISSIDSSPDYNQSVGVSSPNPARPTPTFLDLDTDFDQNSFSSPSTTDAGCPILPQGSTPTQLKPSYDAKPSPYLRSRSATPSPSRDPSEAAIPSHLPSTPNEWHSPPPSSSTSSSQQPHRPLGLASIPLLSRLSNRRTKPNHSEDEAPPPPPPKDPPKDYPRTLDSVVPRASTNVMLGLALVPPKSPLPLPITSELDNLNLNDAYAAYDIAEEPPINELSPPSAQTIPPASSPLFPIAPADEYPRFPSIPFPHHSSSISTNKNNSRSVSTPVQHQQGSAPPPPTSQIDRQHPRSLSARSEDGEAAGWLSKHQNIRHRADQIAMRKVDEATLLKEALERRNEREAEEKLREVRTFRSRELSRLHPPSSR
jgi:hypothetical protein